MEGDNARVDIRGLVCSTGLIRRDGTITKGGS